MPAEQIYRLKSSDREVVYQETVRYRDTGEPFWCCGTCECECPNGCAHSLDGMDWLADRR